jgi:hypothetical protein
MKTAVVGGGAAGFFLAINLKELCPEMEVTIFEKSKKVLAKVEVSGGGRCNCTNSFASVRDLSQVYPRGHRLMKRLFKRFDFRDAYAWFERHGVPLVTQDDECVFPVSQDSHTIINLFLAEARRHGILIQTDCKIILSTTWRNEGIMRMRELWKERNLPGEIFSMTPILLSTSFQDAMNGEMMGMPFRESKALEINAWIYQNAGRDYRYVILDDEDYFFPKQQEHLVLTDESEGLTELKAQKAIWVLNS